MAKTCDTCVKKFTVNCPNSAECYSLPEKPEWESKTEKGEKLMDFNEYLESLLGKRRKRELLRALQEKKAIVITGPSGPTGKTTLAVLLREQGYTVFENGFNNMYEVRLDKPLKECKHFFARSVH